AWSAPGSGTSGTAPASSRKPRRAAPRSSEDARAPRPSEARRGPTGFPCRAPPRRQDHVTVRVRAQVQVDAERRADAKYFTPGREREANGAAREGRSGSAAWRGCAGYAGDEGGGSHGL